MSIELNYLGKVWQLSGNVELPPRPKLPRGHVSESLRGSVTAMGTALMRAIHTRVAEHPLIDDPWGEILVPEEVVHAYEESAMATLGTDPEMAWTPTNRKAALDDYLIGARTYSNVILRSRYAEDALRIAIADGIRQYVLIGAGFDSFGLRQAPLAAEVAVFEVDQPSTQSLKRERIAACGIELPKSVHFVAANLAEQNLDAALASTAYRSSVPALFSWLGVTMFLTAEANRATLDTIASSAAIGSELVFTYLDAEAFRSPSLSFAAIQASVRASGEPFLSGFDPATLSGYLREIGFELLEDLADAELLQRLSPTNSNNLRPLEYCRIARARLVKPATQ